MARPFTSPDFSGSETALIIIDAERGGAFMLPDRLTRFLSALERGVSLQDIGRSASFSAVLSRVALLLSRTGITPNTLTLFSLVPAAAAGIAAATGSLAWAALFLLLSGVLDLLDGPLARATGRTTRFGALLDSTLDRVSDALPLLGLTALFAQSGSGLAAMVPAFTLLTGYTVSYVRARCEGLAVALPPLWMRRGDRMVLMALSLLAGAFALPIALVGTGVAGVLSALAAADALRVARRVIEEGEQLREMPTPVTDPASGIRGA
ncbi:CDP-alcohol phosphatidyltransferase family protein [Phreatobacter aquaticus]|uniref:CDP-alcohol phosphatidyltransferase family protein n=1 Tax=Phreatobacter aquaticus TaxID=2570229 RepID=A0A4D7QPY0_9HYPH|nr:CDP-alcohol phosphatidyltransferase family protein [Phreatobacter aquaticus]QCK86182.1 CDP-alcohol phosphatidyltransferase family protein [Phreatobacter aquaticus]